MNGPGSPPKTSERSTGFRTYAYTALSYALVVLFMPVSRILHLTQWGKWCLEQQQNKQTNQQTRCIQLESRVLAKRGGRMWTDNTSVGIDSNRHYCPKGAELVAGGLRKITEQCNSWVEEGKLIVMSFYKQCSIIISWTINIDFLLIREWYACWKNGSVFCKKILPWQYFQYWIIIIWIWFE